MLSGSVDPASPSSCSKQFSDPEAQSRQREPQLGKEDEQGEGRGDQRSGECSRILLGPASSVAHRVTPCNPEVLPGKPHRQWSLVGYIVHGIKRVEHD